MTPATPAAGRLETIAPTAWVSRDGHGPSARRRCIVTVFALVASTQARLLSSDTGPDGSAIQSSRSSGELHIGRGERVAVGELQPAAQRADVGLRILERAAPGGVWLRLGCRPPGPLVSAMPYVAGRASITRFFRGGVEKTVKAAPAWRWSSS